jgi:hypothetical protein
MYWRTSTASINDVTFYKRDELTSDLICCEVTVGDMVWTLHEELAGWDELLGHLKGLPGFRVDWFECVSQPPFKTNATVAFRRYQKRHCI